MWKWKIPTWSKVVIFISLLITSLLIAFFGFKQFKPLEVADEIKLPSETVEVSVELWVDDFKLDIKEWITYGVEPWLDAVDYPDNYIESETPYERIGNFTFQNLPADAETIINVTLCVNWKTELSIYSRGKAWIWNTTDWVYVGYVGGLTGFKFFNYTITFLDTVEKVNEAQIFLEQAGATGYSAYCDAILLKVFYTTTYELGWGYAFNRQIFGVSGTEWAVFSVESANLGYRIFRDDVGSWSDFKTIEKILPRDFASDGRGREMHLVKRNESGLYHKDNFAYLGETFYWNAWITVFSGNYSNPHISLNDYGFWFLGYLNNSDGLPYLLFAKRSDDNLIIVDKFCLSTTAGSWFVASATLVENDTFIAYWTLNGTLYCRLFNYPNLSSEINTNLIVFNDRVQIVPFYDKVRVLIKTTTGDYKVLMFKIPAMSYETKSLFSGVYGDSAFLSGDLAWNNNYVYYYNHTADKITEFNYTSDFELLNKEDVIVGNLSYYGSACSLAFDHDLLFVIYDVNYTSFKYCWVDLAFPEAIYYDPDYDVFIEPTDNIAIRHAYGRKLFWSKLYDLILLFYADETDATYVVSFDKGLNFTDRKIIRPGCANGWFIYFWLEEYEAENKSYVHYIYNNETAEAPVYYGKGLFLANGTIVSVNETLVFTPPTGYTFYPCAVIVDTNRTPFIQFANFTETHDTANMILGVYQDGVWKHFTLTTFQSKWSGQLVQLPNNQIYAIYTSRTGETHGRLWNGTGLEPDELLIKQRLPAYDNYAFGCLAAPNGDILLVYWDKRGYIRYSWRNYTSGKWEIKSELLTWKNNFRVASPVLGVPNVCYATELGDFVINFFSVATKSLSLVFYEAKDVIDLFYTDLLISDLNVICPFTVNRVLLAYDRLYHFTYLITQILLLEGWNEVGILDADLGKTLGQVNSSLLFDDIEFRFIVLRYTNGTEYVFIFGYVINKDVKILSKSDILFIYVTKSGYWTHTYE